MLLKEGDNYIECVPPPRVKSMFPYVSLCGSCVMVHIQQFLSLFVAKRLSRTEKKTHLPFPWLQSMLYHWKWSLSTLLSRGLGSTHGICTWWCCWLEPVFFLAYLVCSFHRAWIQVLADLTGRACSSLPYRMFLLAPFSQAFCILLFLSPLQDQCDFYSKVCQAISA